MSKVISENGGRTTIHCTRVVVQCGENGPAQMGCVRVCGGKGLCGVGPESERTNQPVTFASPEGTNRYRGRSVYTCRYNNMCYTHTHTYIVLFPGRLRDRMIDGTGKRKRGTENACFYYFVRNFSPERVIRNYDDFNSV